MGFKFNDHKSECIFPSALVPGAVLLSFENPPYTKAISEVESNPKANADRGGGRVDSFEYGTSNLNQYSGKKIKLLLSEPLPVFEDRE